jgi:hypothetical protein|tara:strand:- start:278 stop:1003 length:726 start_codon:yes stop_codon:yes gene_type:complete
MKKIIQILLLSIGLIGCSSIDYSELTAPVSPSDKQINRILALGLTHSENLILARKITDSSIASTVINELENRKTKTDNENIDAEEVARFAEMVKISDDNFKFFGSTISEIKKRNMIGKAENVDYFLLGLKNKSNSLIQHKLNLSITHTSEERRNYTSASFCDKWRNCDDEDPLDINLISSNASNCTFSDCDYTSIMELNLSDDFLRSNMKEGLSINLNSKNITNKITITSEYLRGYLTIAN